ncbi:MAG: hypothetical protein OXD47_10930 [Gammaproteobacteria bacterium]|nr:hypothetical protein [Gammaproteobacteria bacterium]MCY4282548.1 hypothetical protein [Gammaproteobacteria bacterium]MCY4339291.1 hypothetical protein [Gammaproteobacteria bacterium]
MKSHDADDNKFRILRVLIKSCSLMIKNFTSLIILSVVLFMVLDFAYDSVKEAVSKRIPHEHVNTLIEKLKEKDSVQAMLKAHDEYNAHLAESGATAPAFPSPVAFIFFSFLLPVAIIRLLLADGHPKGGLIERGFHNYRHVTSAGYIISSFRYVCAFIAQMFLFIFLTFLLGLLIFAWAMMQESNWFLGLPLLFVAGYIYLLFRFTAVFQLAYVAISIENLGVWESWRRGYALSTPFWIRISALFAIILPLVLLLFAGILISLLPDGEPDSWGTLVSPHIIDFLYVALSAIFSAACYQELQKAE